MRRSQEVPRGVREEKLEGCSPLLTSPSPYFSYWWREMKDWYPWAKGSAGWNLSVAPLSVARNAGLHQEGAAEGRRTEGQVPPAL